jgi:hypothetical protein
MLPTAHERWSGRHLQPVLRPEVWVTQDKPVGRTAYKSDDETLCLRIHRKPQAPQTRRSQRRLWLATAFLIAKTISLDAALILSTELA